MTQAVVLSDPVADPRAFRTCLGQFATGVTVVTTLSGATPVGVTANSFSSLSLDPPLVLWSLARTSRSFEAFSRAGHFNINILAAGQIDVSQAFASKSADKFAGVDWAPGLDGIPVLNGSASTLECATEASHEAGDHLLIIGRVKRCAFRDARGLVFVQGRYGIAEEHPDLLKAAAPPAHAPAEVAQAVTLSTYVHRIHHGKERSFEACRREANLTLTENKVLAALYGGAGQTEDELTRNRYFGKVELQDALVELERRGYLSRSGGRLSLTPEGLRKREAVMGRVADADRTLLEGLDAREVETTKRVLQAIADRLDRPNGRPANAAE